MALQLRRALAFGDRFEDAARSILTDDLLQSEQLGQHAIATQCSDVGIASAAGEGGQHQGAEHSRGSDRIVSEAAVRSHSNRI
jgi:hypothetical protein